MIEDVEGSCAEGFDRKCRAVSPLLERGIGAVAARRHGGDRHLRDGDACGSWLRPGSEDIAYVVADARVSG